MTEVYKRALAVKKTELSKPTTHFFIDPALEILVHTLDEAQKKSREQVEKIFLAIPEQDRNLINWALEKFTNEPGLKMDSFDALKEVFRTRTSLGLIYKISEKDRVLLKKEEIKWKPIYEKWIDAAEGHSSNKAFAGCEEILRVRAKIFKPLLLSAFKKLFYLGCDILDAAKIKIEEDSRHSLALILRSWGIPLEILMPEFMRLWHSRLATQDLDNFYFQLYEKLPADILALVDGLISLATNGRVVSIKDGRGIRAALRLLPEFFDMNYLDRDKTEKLSMLCDEYRKQARIAKNYRDYSGEHLTQLDKITFGAVDVLGLPLFRKIQLIYSAASIAMKALPKSQSDSAYAFESRLAVHPKAYLIHCGFPPLFPVIASMDLTGAVERRKHGAGPRVA